MNNLSWKFIGSLFFCISEVSASPLHCGIKSDRLDVKIIPYKVSFSVGEAVDLNLTINNIGDEAVRLPSFMELESYWLRFEVINEKNERIQWLGPEVKIFETNDHITLEPDYHWGKKIVHFERSYNMRNFGTYRIRAIYGRSPAGSCPFGETASNVIELVVQ